MEENQNTFLPVGSVVMLKGGKKRVMVVGFLGQVEDSEKKLKTYDYIACLYPEGLISMKSNLLFDREQIDKVYSLGYSDEEEKAFQISLNEIYSKLNNNKNNEINQLIDNLE